MPRLGGYLRCIGLGSPPEELRQQVDRGEQGRADAQQERLEQERHEQEQPAAEQKRQERERQREEERRQAAATGTSSPSKAA